MTRVNYYQCDNCNKKIDDNRIEVNITRHTDHRTSSQLHFCNDNCMIAFFKKKYDYYIGGD